MDKVAFITHTLDEGGAATSFLLQVLCSDIKSEEHIFIHPPYNKSDAYRELKLKMPHFQWRLPFAWIFRGAEPGLHRKAYRMVMEGFADFTFLFKYNRVLAREKVQTVYLNSIVLWCLLPVLPQHLNLVIHVRETFDDSLEARLAIWTIRHFADTIIAIDANVAKPFADLHWKVKIVPNPIDMTRVRELKTERNNLRAIYDIPKENFVIALLAPVGQMKGHPFLLKVLEKYRYSGVTFALAGLPDSDNKIVEKLKAYKNVKYFGVVPDVSNIYAISDLVIRCEDYLPLGRTVWEGMYAGLPVLLPVRPEDDKSVIIDYLGRYIYTYNALDVDDCINWINAIHAIRWFVPYPVSSNIKESTEKFVSALDA
jgi:hypothetical protein